MSQLAEALSKRMSVSLEHRTEKDEYGWPLMGTVFATHPLVVYLGSFSVATNPLTLVKAGRKLYESATQITDEWEIDPP